MVNKILVSHDLHSQGSSALWKKIRETQQTWHTPDIGGQLRSQLQVWDVLCNVGGDCGGQEL